jgi:hypothetical protein
MNQRNQKQKEERKREEKDDLGNLFDYPTLSPWIKKSITHLNVWPVS